jgi:hypothetical protein
MAIDTLIDKEDNFEIIRDEIAAILVTESAAQQALAVIAAKDPDLWKLRVFTERSNPIEEWRDVVPGTTDESPIINVWYDNGSFPMNKGNVVERQVHEGVFNIDCYGLGLSAPDGGGHKLGDKEAALEAQRAVRLVRNILMAAIYTYLGQPKQGRFVWRRWPQNITVFQPQIDGRPVQHVVGARVALRVDFNEFSPQVTPETLELVSVDVKRTEDGEIVLNADYNYT